MPRLRITYRISRLLRMLLPIIGLLVLAGIGSSVWLAYWLAKPPIHPYLVTPEQFAHLSDRGVKVTDETWTNKDGSKARGWLLRGATNAPAVILLHRYGADRSWLLNLGVKLNEGTNFTVLWPDLRGHGENPLLKSSSFGTLESDDLSAAIDYLGSLKTPQGQQLVGDQFGIYGVELGGYAALFAASGDTGVRALALDSLPSTPDQLVRAVVKERTGVDSGLLYLFARGGVRLYFLRRYQNVDACHRASVMNGRKVLMMAGGGSGSLHDSTIAIARCFPHPADVEVNSDLMITGFNLSAATSEQSEAYDRRVIEFFDTSLRARP